MGEAPDMVPCQARQPSPKALARLGLPRQGWRNPLAVQWLGLHASTAGAQVQSPVGELRSRRLRAGKQAERLSE